MSSSDIKKSASTISPSPEADYITAAGPSEPPPAFEDIGSTLPAPVAAAAAAAAAADVGADADAAMDLPPQYADIIGSSPANTAYPDANPRHEQPFLRPLSRRLEWFGSTCFLDPELDSDPAFLEAWIRHAATLPIQPEINIRGSHTEIRHVDHHHQHGDRNGDRHANRTETNTVVDFEFQIDLTAFLYSDVRNRKSWSELRTVENHEKTYRGGIFKRQAPDFYASPPRHRLWRRRRRANDSHEEEQASILQTGSPDLGHVDGDEDADAAGVPERGVRGQDKPSLKEWCHRYCASGALRSFELERRIMGFDEAEFRDHVYRWVRSTGYQGDVFISFPARQVRMTIYSDCRTNIWRLTKWIRWVVIITLLVLLVWPYLFFRTKKFNVIVVDWWFSRYNAETGQREFVSISEAEIADFWGPAIREAAMRGRRGPLEVSDAVTARSRGDASGWVGDGQHLQSRIEGAVRQISELQSQVGWGRHQN